MPQNEAGRSTEPCVWRQVAAIRNLHQPRARDKALIGLAVGHGREAVLLAPDQERGSGHARQTPGQPGVMEIGGPGEVRHRCALSQLGLDERLIHGPRHKRHRGGEILEKQGQKLLEE